jgi:hypothetical protein
MKVSRKPATGLLIALGFATCAGAGGDARSPEGVLDIDASTPRPGESRTTVRLLDERDPEHETPAWKLELNGRLRASRLIGETLYLASSHPAPDSTPGYAENDGPRMRLAPPDGCHVPRHIGPSDGYDEFLLISAIDMRTRRVTDVSCLGTNVSGVYMSASSLYVAAAGDYTGNDEPVTVLHKFAIRGGEVSYRATGAVAGALSCSDPTCSMDEHDGDLRVLTSHRSGYRISTLRESTGQNLLLVSSLPADLPADTSEVSRAGPVSPPPRLEGTPVMENARPSPDAPTLPGLKLALLHGDTALVDPEGQLLAGRRGDLNAPPRGQ